MPGPRRRLLLLQRAGDVEEGVDTAGDRRGDRTGIGVDGGIAAGHGARRCVAASSRRLRSTTTTRMWSPPTSRLSAAGVAAGDDPAVVDHDDVVGEALGLVEVLGGEQQRGAVGRRGCRARPTARCGHGGRGRSWARRGRAPRGRPRAWRRGRGAGACRRSSRDHRSRGVGRARTPRAARRRGRRRRLRGSWCSSPSMTRFSRPVSEVVDGGVLGGEADAPAHLRGLGAHVEAGDDGRARVGVGERGEDAHGGGLARAVRAEHGGDGADGHLEVDAGERQVVAVALGEPAGDDGVLGRIEGARHVGQLTLVAGEVEVGGSGVGRGGGVRVGHGGSIRSVIEPTDDTAGQAPRFVSGPPPSGHSPSQTSIWSPTFSISRTG